jgi:hypothetical protein
MALGAYGGHLVVVVAGACFLGLNLWKIWRNI